MSVVFLLMICSCLQFANYQANGLEGFHIKDLISRSADLVLKEAFAFCTKVLNKVNIISKNNEKKKSCEDVHVLAPLANIFVEQTRKGGQGSDYQDNLAILAGKFVRQITLIDILRGAATNNLFQRLTEPLPDLAADAFARTGIENEIKLSYQLFIKKVSTDLLLNLVIGRDTDPLFVINEAAVREAFKNHDELDNVLELYRNIRNSYNLGKKDIWHTLLNILKNIGFSFSG